VRALTEDFEEMTTMPVTFRVLGPADGAVLQNVAEDVFDYPVDARWSAEFLADPRHHLAVVIDDEKGQVVGMASGVHYVHPDKAPELWVNEVGVAPSHQGQGIGRRVLASLLAHGRTLGCHEAWVLTSPDNTAARRMYAAAGGLEDAEPSVMFTFTLDGEADVDDGKSG
jgi:RimJ/RimL family protein N-acetyltransferase